MTTDYRKVGDVKDLWDGKLDYRRRQLYLDTVSGPRQITALVRSDWSVVVGAGTSAKSISLLPFDEGVFERTGP